MLMGCSGGMEPAEGNKKLKEELVEFVRKRSEIEPRYADRLHACGVLRRKRTRAAAARQHHDGGKIFSASRNTNKNKLDGDQKEGAVENRGGDKVGRKGSILCSRSQTSAACCSRRRRRRKRSCSRRRRRRRSCCRRRRRRRSCRRRRRRSRCGRRRRRSRCRRRRRRSCRRRRRRRRRC